MVRVLALLALTGLLTGPVRADPLLLTSLPFIRNGGTCPFDLADITAVSMELGYEGLPESGPGTECDAPRIGCTPIPVADLATERDFDFTQANSSAWDFVVSLLTNGENDRLHTVFRTFGAGGPLVLASGTSGLESSRLGGTPDLVGNTITLIRLHVSEFVLEPSGCGGVDYHLDAVWEFYTDDRPTPVHRTTFGGLKARYR